MHLYRLPPSPQINFPECTAASFSPHNIQGFVFRRPCRFTLDHLLSRKLAKLSSFFRCEVLISVSVSATNYFSSSTQQSLVLGASNLLHSRFLRASPSKILRSPISIL